MSLPVSAAAATSTPGTSDADGTRLRGRWLVLARVAWVATAAVTLAMGIAATPIALHLLQIVCVLGHCAQQINQLTPAQADDLRRSGISLGFYAAFVIVWQWIGTLIYAGIAAVIFWRRSDDRMALFAAFTLVTFGGAGGGGFTDVLPPSNPAWTVPVDLIGIVVGQVGFYVFFCLFPSGRFVPRWLRGPALLWTVMWLLTLLPVAPLDALVTGPTLPFLAGIGILVFGQVYRFRRASTPVERQQTKWVVFGFALGVGGFLALLVFGNLVLKGTVRNNGLNHLFANAVLNMLLWLVPISIGIAILRSRLWDIDIIIRRTLVYGTLTALLAAVYFGCVIGVQAIIEVATGRQGPTPGWLIVATTLLIAALFTPLRRRIQAGIDHRFYRRKYDAARTLARFAVTLRSETDLEALRAHLVTVVQATMQPEHATLWLRQPERRPKP
jgi:hypothetical protein